MVVISSAELRGNMKKYLDIAKKEQVLIQRGKNETFVLTAQQNPIEYDLALAKVREGLTEMFERKETENVKVG